MRRTSPSRRLAILIGRFAPRVWPVLFILFGSFVFVLTVPEMLNQSANIRAQIQMPVPQPGTGSNNSVDVAKALQSRLDVIEREATRAQWILTLLTAIAALFTILQGAFNFFSATTYVKQADDAIKQIKEHEERIKEGIPTLIESERRRQDLLRELRAKFELLNLHEENLYVRVGLMTRQRILSIESLLGIDLLGEAEESYLGGKDNVGGNLLALGRFYVGKYQEQPYDPDVFDRAHYYLELAKNRVAS